MFISELIVRKMAEAEQFGYNKNHFLLQTAESEYVYFGIFSVKKSLVKFICLTFAAVVVVETNVSSLDRLNGRKRERERFKDPVIEAKSTFNEGQAKVPEIGVR